ncbi:hypothetical protein DYI37_17265 [Fulvimarina endophytica]|uniref:Heme peroxidase n=1 Tax=Fulvimarina endophytica TaxID=2293836 RepID=A0A371WZP7_9HYPH|nr:peroxidase family protein [Fulvimarina endophytica]RFC62254.1 hypothetical protein DYI37_17265 [Fulvimarina endophytica]
MSTFNASLKPFVINATDIRFLTDQVGFLPLFDAQGRIIVAWDGVGPVFDFSGNPYAEQGSPQANLAKWGQSYQNFTDLSGTRDVSGYWNNLAPLLAHYGDTGQLFPRMMTADYSGYLVQVTGNPTIGPVLVASSEPVATTTQENVQVLLDSGVYSVFSAPGVAKTIHEIVTSGTSVSTAVAAVTSTVVNDGHHIALTATTTTTSSTTTTTSYDYVQDETRTVLTSANGTSETVSTAVVATSDPVTVTQSVDGIVSTVFSGGELVGELNGVKLHGFTTDYALSHQDYTVQAALGGAEGDTVSSDGTAINIRNVVDYTPRMISRTITTAGVTYDTWANHSDNPAAGDHRPGEIYYGADGVSGEATVLDWGALETVANGGLGQVDTQARLEASAGQNDHFIGSLNPGVSPSNGFFVLFGQFFDHGLDFIDKGQSDGAGRNVTIKIALGVDDPLYGMLGPDGRPVTEITINRSTVETLDANGSEYVNHVSPFIDQSQTYGSDVQRTQLLREWVSSDGGQSFHAGMKLLDGATLQTPWARPDGTLTHETLPTLNELRAHIDATGRASLTWDDIGNLRNRDGAGQLSGGSSGESLLLDMNPRFDTAHLIAAQGETPAEVARVEAAIAFLNTYGVRPAHPDGQGGTVPADTFGFNQDGMLALTLGSDLSMGPGQPVIAAGTSLTGASALAGWVDFSNFSIMQTPPGIPSTFIEGVRSAVSDILMASVGDHYIAGDGRANENFGLTSIHHVFHEEHNYQVENLIDALHRQDVVTNDVTHEKLHEFQIDTGHGMNAAGDYLQADGVSISWNEDKIFQGAKLIVEMEYQHAAVDQYARNVSPNIQEFVGYSPDKQPDVTMEYSQAAFRFGHSTLRETIDTIDPTHGITGKIMGYALHDAFLSPESFGKVGPGSILLGMTHQQQSEIDEFVTPALNQGLLGQPLDLAAINIARGRDVGLPALNDFREALGLQRYTSWNDFGQNMQHPSSLANFIAAYSFDGALDKANAVLDLASQAFETSAAGLTLGAILGWAGPVADLVSRAYAFLSGDETRGGAGTLGFNQIDTWLGGLAEVHQPGGLLGETFDTVFVAQIESLMDGDRFYYLYRLAGQQFGEEVANGQLKDLVERNTGLVHLNGNVFGYADQYVDLGARKEVVAEGAEALTTGNEHKYGDLADVASGAIGIYSNGGLSSANDGHLITINGQTYVQDTRLQNLDPDSVYALNDFMNLDGTPNTGAESNEVIVGTAGNDLIYAQGGDDTVYGEDGDDIIYGGFGIDRLYGGAGSDRMYGGDNPDLMDGGSGDDFLYGESSGTDINGADQIIGGSGNDYIEGGVGIDKLSAGSGDDIIHGGQDTDPFTHGGDGNDLVFGDSGGDILYGDNGDDIVVGGADQDQLFGNDGDDILLPGDPTGALTIGGDEVLGGDGVDRNDKGFDLIDFSDNTVRPGGVRFDLFNQANPATTPNGSASQVQSFQLDGVIGSAGDDTIIGNDETSAGAGADASIAGDNWLIGGSGNDTFTGMGGNDIIVGGSIRLDALIGRYSQEEGTADYYNHNNGNDGLTEEDRLQDALYQGASHRVAWNETIDGSGLLDGSETGMFDKHFTEMLRTRLFKDTVLGDGDGGAPGQGGDLGKEDTAVYSGTIDLDRPDRSDYRVEAVDAHGDLVADPHADGFFALRITDMRTATDFIDANGQAILDANGVPLSNEGTDLLIGIENLRFANGTVKAGAFFDKAPSVDLHAQLTNVSLAASDAFAGSPSNNPYGRGSGWTGGWTETADGNGSSSSGQIHYQAVGQSDGVLQINGGPGSGFNNPYNGASISRGVNLSGYGTAHVSFDVSESGLGVGETVEVWMTDNQNTPGANDVLVTTIDRNTGNAGTVSFDVTGNFTQNSRLFFVATAMNAVTDVVQIDNISVTATRIVDAAPGNDYSVNYTEQQAAPPAIASTPSITDQDDTLIFSARAVIRDAVTGDRLTVGTLPAGIVAAGSGTGAIVLTSQLGASHADFQTALEAITFSNAGDDPTAADRHIDVTVNDGLRDSAVATTTVHVTPVDDPATALAADSIVTNLGYTNSNSFGGTTITVADWMLAANDTDVDGVVISGAANLSGLANVAHSSASGSVSFVDRGGPGGTFSYTSGALSATVSVTQQTSGTTLNATSGSGQILLDNGSAHTISGGAGADIIVGGGGNDTINAGGSDDTIVWNANNAGGGSNNGTDGRDVVDGGSNGAAGDTFVINGSNSSETFNLYTRADWLALGGTGNNGHTAAVGTEIVITRGGTTNGAVIAELRNVEELVINTGGGSDTVNVSGNFDATHLNYNTIHINDEDGGDTVDITRLASDHRIVFSTDASGQVIGDTRPQDIVNVKGSAQGGQPGDATGTGQNASGSGAAEIPDDDPSDLEGDADTPQDGASQSEPPSHPTEDSDAGFGTADPDLLVGGAGADILSGLSGDDLIFGQDGDDTLLGGDGNDLIKGGAGRDVIMGGTGADDLFGDGGDDMIFGDDGSDRIFAGEGHDIVEGGAGADTVYLGAGDDRVIATMNDGDDVYWGDAGTDTLDLAAIMSDLTVDLGSGLMQHGSVSSIASGYDTIFGFENVIGGAGNDTIVASNLANVMDGGGGNDTFVFNSAEAARGDTIVGFQPGDVIDLSGIDADRGSAGHQNFVLFAGTSFTAIGQVMVTHETRDDGEHTLVTAHLSEDGADDFSIDLTGRHDLTKADFHGIN